MRKHIENKESLEKIKRCSSYSDSDYLEALEGAYSQLYGSLFSGLQVHEFFESLSAVGNIGDKVILSENEIIGLQKAIGDVGEIIKR